MVGFLLLAFIELNFTVLNFLKKHASSIKGYSATSVHFFHRKLLFLTVIVSFVGTLVTQINFDFGLGPATSLRKGILVQGKVLLDSIILNRLFHFVQMFDDRIFSLVQKENVRNSIKL